MADDTYLGFLSLNETDGKDGFLGALLVTDQLGRPVEFRVTYPVKPTRIQRPLYGNTLEPFIGVELCGKQLLSALDHELQFMAVNLGYLLQIRPDCDFPVLHLQRAGDAIEVKTPGSGVLGAIRLASSNERFQPLSIRAADGYAGDYDQARPMIEDLFSYMDLLEPFERIRRSLEVLASQDTRFL